MVVRGVRRPPLDQLLRWAEVLALTEAERDRFLIAGIAAHLPKDYAMWLESTHKGR